MTAAPPALHVAHCPHCGTAVEGEEDAFCCAGCRAAAEIIHGAGLDRYYAERDALPPRPVAHAVDWRGVPTTTHDDGTCSVRLAIDGLRCASCVWVTEHVLAATPGVREATVSYATGRATLRWDPDAVSLDALAGRVATLGYRPRLLGEEAAPDEALLVRLGVSAFFAVNVMLLSASIYAGWLGGMEARFEALFRWSALLLATPIALWCATPFYEGAWGGLRHRSLSMDLPVSLGVLLMYGHGVFATLTARDGFLDSLAMLVTLLLAGRVLESRGRRRAAEAATALAAHLPRTARRVEGDGSITSVSVDALRPDDLVEIGAGGEVPVDGVVEAGEGLVAVGLLTGESEPVQARPGARVVAGAVVLDGHLRVRAHKVGEDTLLHAMATGLTEAADRGVQPSAADRLAPWFTLITLALAAGALAGWTWGAGLERAIAVTVAVLVVACPCALALAQPLAAAAGLGAAARRGLLLRSGDALLALADVDLVALDKTGTLTSGRPEVTHADDAVLRIAAGLERASHHPIAQAVLEEAIARGIPLPDARDLREVAGQGVSGEIDGVRWTLAAGGPGQVDLIGPDGRLGAITLRDTLRDDARTLVDGLRALGLRVVLLTGDHPDVARAIGAQAGIDEVLAGRDPSEKRAQIRAWREAGHRVLFAGDGLNDGPALTEADVGVAMGTGAASSVLAADGALARAAIAPLAAGVLAARAARRAIRGNLVRSLGYNVLAVTAALAGLVNPLIAALLMPASSLLVVWGASRVEPAVARSAR